MDQFGNREDESSRECPSPDDSSAGICVSDDRVEFLEDVTAVIFGRHGPSYLPSYFGREHAPRRAVTRRKISILVWGLVLTGFQSLSNIFQKSSSPAEGTFEMSDRV